MKMVGAPGPGTESQPELYKPEPRTQAAEATQVLAYCLHRSGSNILGLQLEWICSRLDVPFHTSNQAETLEEIRHLRWRDFIGGREGCFGPIRPGEANPCIPLDLDPYSLLLQVRDPRDVLTSLYFALIHVFPLDPSGYPQPEQQSAWREAGIDAFVLEKSTELGRRYRYLLESECFQKATLLRYEEMVTDHASWARKVLTAFRGRADPDQMEPLHRELTATFADAFVTAGEDVHMHKRQVLPGDYRRKLSSRVIRELNRRLADVLHSLEYSLE